MIVDVVDLKFVNSSAIRLFVDWATAVKNAGTPYRLKFKGKRAVAWQRTAFMALVLARQGRARGRVPSTRSSIVREGESAHAR